MALTNLDKDNVSRLMSMLYKEDHLAIRNKEISEHCHTSYAKVTMLAQQIQQLNEMAKSIIDHSVESHQLLVTSS